jgi:hypothetical protein
MIIAHNAGDNVAASVRSVQRWAQRIVPFQMTGNRGTVKIAGQDLFNLMMYRMIYPTVTADEMRCFLITSNTVNPVVFSRKDIYVSENILDLTRKRGSSTAFQALTPFNILRRQIFWNSPPPLGVRTMNRANLLDLDEAAFFLISCVRHDGKAYIGVRVNESGPYGHSEKWVLIMCIDPNGWKHAVLRQMTGLTAADFLYFFPKYTSKTGCSQRS